MSVLSWLLYATHVPASGSGGGMVRYVVELARSLQARDDIDLSVLTTSPARPFFSELLGREDRVLTVPQLPVPARAALERLGAPGLATLDSFDVVHGTKHLLPRQGGRTRLLTVHDMLPLDRPQDFGALKRTLLTRPYLASVREANGIVCVSRATEARLLEYAPDVAGRTFPVPLAMSSALRTAASEPVESLAGRRFVLVVGDPSPRKNVAFIVDLWRRVAEMRPGTVLAVVGPPGWGTDQLGRTRDALVTEGLLHQLGHVSDGRLRWCYENAAVVLCPSVLEGFGLPAIEARAFAAPLITSMDPALCEVSGDSAVHLPADDAEGWTSAILAALDTGRPGEPVGELRGWDQVAGETVQAARALSS